MNKRYIRIVGFGLIGTDGDREPYRQVIFKDDTTGVDAEMFVSKKERPSLWEDIIKLEQGGNLPPYRGFITKFNTLDIVVFNTETIEEAFSRQKKKLNVKSKINYSKAEELRLESTAYTTNITHPNAIEIAWRSIDTEAHIIKYRAYTGKGTFVWSNWYEIEDK
jgi:hypothetical protein